jgi:hypothetical protein
LTGSLYDKVVKMREQNLIRDIFAEAALGVKDFGNDMAHGGIEVEVTDEDVIETLNLMTVVLEKVYQVEVRTKSLQDRVASRKAKSSKAEKSSS